MLKWFSIFISYFLGRFNKPTQSFKALAIEVFDEVSFKSRRLISLSLSAMGSVILFCGGLLILVMESASQYDHLGYLTWTAMLASGIGLILFSGLVFAGIFIFAWPNSQSHAKQQINTQTPTPHPLESALAEIILDFAKSRHESAKSQSPQYQQHADEAPSQPLHH